MKLSLSLEGDASTIAMVVAYIASLPAGAAPSISMVANAPNMAPQPMPIPPMPAHGGGGDDEGDDNGPVNLNAPAVDSAGMPWDERIHSSTRTVKASDGTWTARRNGPKGAELAAIEAELRARVGGQQQPAPQPQPMPMPVPQPAPVMQPQPMPVPQPAPVPMPAPQPQPQPMPVPMPAPEPAPQPVQAMQPAAIEAAVGQATGTLDFSQFMQHLTALTQRRDAQGAPLVHADYLAGITQEISNAFQPLGFAPLSAITDITGNPQMITFAVQCMQRDGRW